MTLRLGSLSGNTEPGSFLSQYALSTKVTTLEHVILQILSMVFCVDSRDCVLIRATLDAWLFLVLTGYESSLQIYILAMVVTILTRRFSRTRRGMGPRS